MSTILDIEDIKNANSHISAMALTKAWAETFKKYALNDNEDLTDNPASSFNIFTHLTAQSAAKMMYEQAARINETNESTAILPKSLLNKLSNEELTGIFGTPSSTTVAFCLKKDDIINNSIQEDDSGLRRLVINKGLTVVYESHPAFILPYDVIINVKPIISNYTDSKSGLTDSYETNNIYAYYDIPALENDGMRSIYEINNQYISSREIRYDNAVYVAFFFKMFQIERKEIKLYVSDPDTVDTSISFNDSLVGVEVFRTPAGKNTYERLMTGTPEGTINTSKDFFNYSYDYKRNKQNYNLIFNKSKNAKLTTGDNLRIIVYTTKGTEGNIDFPYMAYNLTSMSVNYDQNLSVQNQNAMLNIVTIAFARDANSTGGRNQLTLDEIRNKIIEKKYSRSVIITDNEIVNKAKQYRYDCKKIRHDVINMYYRAYGKIIYNNMILSTGTDTFYFDLSLKEQLAKGYNYYMIEPTDVFKYDNKKFYYIPRYCLDTTKDTVETYAEYAKIYNETDNPESVIEVSFPFYMRYDNTAYPKITVYDMNVKNTDILSFTSYNEEYALDKIDIPYIRIQRNPYRGVTDGSFNEDIANNYYINFIVYTGENTLNKMYLQAQEGENSPVNSDDPELYNYQYIVFDLEMIGNNSQERYTINPTSVKINNINTMLEDGFISYQAIITTNNFVSDDQIQMKGIKRSASLGSDYATFYAMDTEIAFNITGRFTDIGDNSAFNCIKYESENIKLVRDLTEYFGIDFDINTNENQFESYEANVPYTYTEQEYLKNPNYDPNNPALDDVNHYEYQVNINIDGQIDFLPGIDENGNTVSIPVYKVKHNIGDVIVDYKQLTDVEIGNGPLDTVEYYTLVDEFNQAYEKIEDLKEFDKDTTYYRGVVRLKHKAGDTKIFNKNTGELMPDEVDLSNVLAEYHPIPPKYIGLLKNVPWINRLYFANSDMYEKIRELYLDIVDNVIAIKNVMFDGGIIYMGLIKTSGSSKKYFAFNLTNNQKENLNNIAIKLVFRVKFKSNDSIEYKQDQIVQAASNYVSEINESNEDLDFSIDGMFEKIKELVPDIQYINLIQLNNYYNGEVQTVLNDATQTAELLTVSQKTVTDDEGNITFIPDITVNVVNSEG